MELFYLYLYWGIWKWRPDFKHRFYYIGSLSCAFYISKPQKKLSFDCNIKDILTLWCFILMSVLDEEANNVGWHIDIFLSKFSFYNRLFRPLPFKYETFKMSRMISPFVKNNFSLNNISFYRTKTYILCVWKENNDSKILNML
jgi:hypothetical protein